MANIKEIKETIESFSACKFDRCCSLCPLSTKFSYGNCIDELDDMVMKTLKEFEALKEKNQNDTI